MKPHLSFEVVQSAQCKIKVACSGIAQIWFIHLFHLKIEACSQCVLTYFEERLKSGTELSA